MKLKRHSCRKAISGLLLLGLALPCQLYGEDSVNTPKPNKPPPSLQDSENAGAKTKAEVTGGAEAAANDIAPLSNPQNGGVGSEQRQQLNTASAKLMELGAEKDKLLEGGDINLQYWMMMSQGMAKAFNKGLTSGSKGSSAPVDYGNTGSASSAAAPATSALNNYRQPSDSLIIEQSTRSALPAIPRSNLQESEPNPQIVNLGGQLPIIGNLQSQETPERDTHGQASTDSKLQFDEKAKDRDLASSGPAAVQMGVLQAPIDKSDEPTLTGTQKALLKLQSAAFKKAAKSIADRNKAQDAADGPFKKSEAASQDVINALRKDVKALNFRPTSGGPLEEGGASGENKALELAARGPASLDDGQGMDGFKRLFENQDGESMWPFLVALFIGFTASLFALYRFLPRKRKSLTQLVVPNDGEHFAIRESATEGEYILDIKDVRGNLLRTVGMLRSQSVVRAAVLPPGLAVKLGADGSFDRFEFIKGKGFAPTNKPEGYQVFPFLNDTDKKTA